MRRQLTPLTLGATIILAMVAAFFTVRLIRGNNWAERVDNNYFPLYPGSVMVYEDPTGEVRETITVLSDTKRIGEIEATVVKDVTREDGEVAEETFDWYAQDDEGNVWYLGESTIEYEDGVANPAGSWEHGADGARGGIIMRAEPEVGDVDWQERDPGEAESMSWTLQTRITKEVPGGTFVGSVRTLEWSPLEPGVVGEKVYAPGVGLIYEEAITGGELLELVEIRK